MMFLSETLRIAVTLACGSFVLASASVSSRMNSIVSSSFPSGNLVKNGSFENYYSDFVFQGWHENASNRYSPNFVDYLPLPVEDAVTPFSGRQMAAIQFKVPASLDRFLVAEPFPLKPNTWYTFFLQYKTSYYVPAAGTDSVRPIFQAFRKRDISPETGDQQNFPDLLQHYGPGYQTSTGWIQYVHRFKTGSEANFGTVSLLSGSVAGVSGTFYFDDVYLTEGCIRASSTELLPTGCATNDDVPFGKDARHPNFIAVSRKYFDGNNALIQTGVQNGNRDIVSQTFHDEIGRSTKTTLPIGGNFGVNEHKFIPGITTLDNGDDLLSLYYHPAKSTTIDDPILSQPASKYPDAGGVAYNEIKYEDSPLGRVIETAGAGNEWKMGSGHTMKITYSSLESLENPEQLPDFDPSETGGKYFVKEVTGPEASQVSREFRDKSGKVVRTSSRLRVNETLNGDPVIRKLWLNTDFRYDENGNLVKIEAPTAEGARLTTSMQYNDLNQLVSESTDATGTIRYLYDELGRSRFSQSAVQAKEGSFSFTKYDDLGRAVSTGEITNSSFFTQAKAIIPEFPCSANCSSPMAEVAPNIVKLRTLNHYDTDNPQLSCVWGENGTSGGYVGPLKDFAFLVKDPTGTVVYASLDLINAYQVGKEALQGQSGNAQILVIVNPQGTHEISPPKGSDIELKVGSLEFTLNAVYLKTPEGEEAKQAFDLFYSQYISGLLGPGEYLQGRLVKSLSCNYELSTALGESRPREVSKTFRYDKFGNIVKVLEVNGYVQNTLNREQLTLNTYDIQNRLLRKTICGDNACSAALSHVENYHYDQMSRIEKITDKDGNSIIENHYNYIGQMTAQIMGGDLENDSPQALIKQATYNLHQEIISNRASHYNTPGAALFAENLTYEDGTIPRFNGNITSASYSFPAQTVAIPNLRYDYTYDDLDRLTQASTIPDANAGSTYKYLDDGRISSTDRAGKMGTYSYFNGKLKEVKGDLVPNRSMELAVNQDFVFNYDENGNLIIDKSKSQDGQPLEVYYRSDNLPYMFVYKTPSGNSGQFDLSTAFMAYDESGRRITKCLYKNDEWKECQEYSGSGWERREFRDTPTLAFFGMAGVGRVQYDLVHPAGTKEFYITDHSGSTRVVYDLTSGQFNYGSHYFPYGKQFGEFKSASAPVTPKYTGKELDEDINLSYFGARYYDAELGMWISPDPARQFASPYATSGNPINNVDPNGLEEIDADFIGPLLPEDWRAGDADGQAAAFHFIDTHPDQVRSHESTLMGHETLKFFKENFSGFGLAIHGGMAEGFHYIGFYENAWNRTVNVGISPVYSDGTVRDEWKPYMLNPNSATYIRIHNQDLRKVLPIAEHLATSCVFCSERLGRALVGAAYISEKGFGQSGGPMEHHVK